MGEVDVAEGAGKRALEVTERGVDAPEASVPRRRAARSSDEGHMLASGRCKATETAQAVGDHLSARNDDPLGEFLDVFLRETYLMTPIFLESRLIRWQSPGRSNRSSITGQSQRPGN
jgi:hypothetical protein